MKPVGRSLRIALCAPEWARLEQALCGGQADATYIIQKDVAAGLQSSGHQLTFIAPRGLADLIATSDPTQPIVAPRSWSASRLFEISSSVFWRLQQFVGIPYLNVFTNWRRYDALMRLLPGHDVVYERNSMFNAATGMACRRLGLPYVLFVEADEILEHDYMGRPLTGWLRWRSRRIFRHNLQAADRIICVSAQLKRHLADNWAVLEEKMVVFPNAVDVARFQPDPEIRARTRARLGITTEPLIIFVGSFYEWHDVATLLAAFAQCLVVHPEGRLVLIGDGEQRERMERRAAELGLNSAVQFTGLLPRDEIPAMMGAADIAVAPYPKLDHDIWLSPLKLYEYLAAGAVVVASSVGQITDVIRDGQNGLLVPPADVNALASKLSCLMEEPELRQVLSQQARQDAVENHSWREYLAQLDQLLHSTAAAK